MVLQYIQQDENIAISPVKMHVIQYGQICCHIGPPISTSFIKSQFRPGHWAICWSSDLSIHNHIAVFLICAKAMQNPFIHPIALAGYLKATQYISESSYPEPCVITSFQVLSCTFLPLTYEVQREGVSIKNNFAILKYLTSTGL